MAKWKPMTIQLPIGEVDDDELTVVLSSVLPRGAQFRPGEVEYRTMADEWVLSLQYKDDKIVGAVAGPAMTPELEKRIRTEIERVLLAPASTKICRWTLFSTRPVEGHWRYRDQFQIVPAPPDAPRPEELVASHPFVLDFVVRDSTDSRIRQNRYVRRATDLTLVLNLLLRQRISGPSMRGRKHWVWAPPGSEVLSVWAQEGYLIPNFQYLVDDFPLIANVPPLAELPAETYYDSWAGYADILTIPAELTLLLDAFGALTGDERERFLRACFWYHTASTVWDYAQSLYFTSLIKAIECLSSVGPERSTSTGPSNLFVTFMKQFAPGSPSKTQVDKIYDVRGEITHGERLLHLDQVRPPGLDQTSARDREIGDNARLLCQGAMINWLWSNNPTATKPLLTNGLPPTELTRPGTKTKVIVTTTPDGHASQA